MEIEDVIKNLTAMKHNYDMRGKSIPIISLNIGIEVLKKQIPKAIIDNGYNIKFCPKCNGTVWQIKDESNYCFRCGQKLEW